MPFYLKLDEKSASAFDRFRLADASIDRLIMRIFLVRLSLALAQ